MKLRLRPILVVVVIAALALLVAVYLLPAGGLKTGIAIVDVASLDLHVACNKIKVIVSDFTDKAISLAIGWLILLALATTPFGQLLIAGIFILMLYSEKYIDACLFAVIFIIPAFFIASAKCRRGGDPRRGRKENAVSGPIGGSHVAEAMLLDKHADNPLVRGAARKLRDAGVPPSVIGQILD